MLVAFLKNGTPTDVTNSEPLPAQPLGWVASDTYKDANAVTITAAAAIWTPASGKAVRLVGGTISVSAAGSVLFKEAGSGATVFRTPKLLANTPYDFAPPGGRLLAYADVPLLAVLSVAGTITGTVWGAEETAAAPPVPVAEFTGTPLTGSAPLSVAFDDSGSTGYITAYLYESNDGGGWATFDTTSSPTHAFAAGTYSIRLTVTGPGGTHTKTRTNYLTVSP